MLTAALLGLMRQLGLDIIILTEELNDTEFFASRFTRRQTLKLLKNLTLTASNLPAETRQSMKEIDWAAWSSLGRMLSEPSQHPFQIWVAIKELTPMTLQHLNDYKRKQPQLFSMVV